MKVYGYFIDLLTESNFEREGILHHEEISDFCRYKKFEIVSMFKDNDDSLHSFLGVEFRRMVKEMILNNINTIVIDSLEHLSIETLLQEQIVYYLASKKIDLITVNSGQSVTRITSGEYLKSELIKLQGMFSELDKSLNMIKLRKFRETVRKKTGKCEGRKSYMEIAPEVIKEIKRLRRRRKRLKKNTFADIAKKLNESGFVTATGKAFTGNNVSVILHRLPAA